MKKQIIGLASLTMVAVGAVMPTVASAEILGNKNLSANFAVTTNYYFRGFTQDEDGAALQAGLDYAFDNGFYIGTWGSTVDDDVYAGSGTEIDIYGGWAGELGPVGIDVGYLRYMYPGDNVPNDNDTNEWHIGLSHDFGLFALSGTVYHSDDYFGADDANYYELGIDVPINDDWSTYARIGHTDYDKSPARGGGDDYSDGNIGVATSLGPIGVDLMATNTWDVAGGCGHNGCESQVILTFSVEL